MVAKKSKLVIYKAKRSNIELEVNLWKNTIWLSQAQIAELFGTKRPAITKHLGNIFKAGELKKKSVSSILEHTAADGKRYKTQFYSLDAVISVGYRVNSKRATQFRIWATEILRKHIVEGYTFNQKRLVEVEGRLLEVQQAIDFLNKKSVSKRLDKQGKEILNLLASYSKTLVLLDEYDKGRIVKPRGRKGKYRLDYKKSREVVIKLTERLVDEKKASDLFGNEVDGQFEGIINNLYQTFDGKELYRTIEEKAANLIYLVIKDHPFSDGNKRIASYLFVYFLDRNNYLYRRGGEKKINDNALVVLALLIAESNPDEKDVIVKMICNLITGN